MKRYGYCVNLLVLAAVTGGLTACQRGNSRSTAASPATTATTATISVGPIATSVGPIATSVGPIASGVAGMSSGTSATPTTTPLVLPSADPHGRVESGPQNQGQRAARAPLPLEAVGQVRVTTTETTTLTQLGLRATGTIDEARALGLSYVFVDRNGDGQLDAGDPPLASGFQFVDDGRIVIEGLTVLVSPTQPLDLLLATEILGTAEIGDSVSFQVEGAACRILDPTGRGVALEGAPRSGSLQIVDGANPAGDLALTRGAVVPDATVPADAQGVPMLRLLVQTTTGGMGLHGLRFQTSGTGDDAVDVLEVRIGRDRNFNGMIDEDNDEVLARARPERDDGPLVFHLDDRQTAEPGRYPNMFFRPSGANYMVDYALAGTAAPGRTFSLRLASGADVTAFSVRVDTGSEATLPGGPIQGSTLTVGARTSGLAVREAGPTVRTDSGDQARVALTLELQAGDTGATLRDVSVGARGSLNDATDVASLGLYLDSDNNQAFDPVVDRQLASSPGPNLDDDVVRLLLQNPLQLQPRSRTRVFVTATLAPGLPAGKSFYLSLEPARDLTLSGATPVGAPVTGTLVVTGRDDSQFVQPDAELGKDTTVSTLLQDDNFGHLALEVGDRPARLGRTTHLSFVEFPLPGGPAPARAYVALFLSQDDDIGVAGLGVEVAQVLPSGPRTPWLEGRGGRNGSYDGMINGLPDPNGLAFSGLVLGSNSHPDQTPPDSTTAPLDTVRVDAGSSGRWVVFDVTAAAQAWYAGAPNYGLCFRDAPAVLDEGTARFLSSDASQANLRPIFLLVH